MHVLLCAVPPQEQVAECRELNSTEVWLAVAATVTPLCQSMPLLLHHQVQMIKTCTCPLKCSVVGSRHFMALLVFSATHVSSATVCL